MTSSLYNTAKQLQDGIALIDALLVEIRAGINICNANPNTIGCAKLIIGDTTQPIGYADTAIIAGRLSIQEADLVAQSAVLQAQFEAL